MSKTNVIKQLSIFELHEDIFKFSVFKNGRSFIIPFLTLPFYSKDFINNYHSMPPLVRAMDFLMWKCPIILSHQILKSNLQMHFFSGFSLHTSRDYWSPKGQMKMYCYIRKSFLINYLITEKVYIRKNWNEASCSSGWGVVPDVRSEHRCLASHYSLRVLG